MNSNEDIQKSIRTLSERDNQAMDAFLAIYSQRKGLELHGSHGLIVNIARFLNFLEDERPTVHIIDPESLTIVWETLTDQGHPTNLQEEKPIATIIDGYRDCVMTFPKQSVDLFYITAYMQTKNLNLVHRDLELFKNIQLYDDKDILEGRLVEPRAYYICNFRQLYYVLTKKTESATTKFGSILVTLYPYVRGYFSKNGMVTNYVVRQPEDEVPGAVTRLPFAVIFGAISCYLFTYAYSEETTYMTQVWKRYSAMCASSGVEPLPEPTLREQVQRFGVVLTYRSGVITEGIGRVICGNDIEENPFRTMADVPDYNNLLDGARGYTSSRIIRDQLKLIMVKFQQIYLGFGMMINPALLDLLSQLSDGFQAQVQKMAELSGRYKGADYAGLRKTLPGSLEVRAHAMVIYCGLLFHARTITDPAKKEKFNVEGVGKHITSLIDRTECKSVAARLPMPTSLFIAKSVKHLTAPLIDSQLTEAKISAEEVFAICHMRNIMGPWADDYFQRHYGSNLAAALESILDSSVRLIEERRAMVEDILKTIVNPDFLTKIRRRLNNWSVDWTKSKRKFQSTVNKKSVNSVIKENKLYMAVRDVSKPALREVAAILREIGAHDKNIFIPEEAMEILHEEEAARPPVAGTS